MAAFYNYYTGSYYEYGYTYDNPSEYYGYNFNYENQYNYYKQGDKIPIANKWPGILISIFLTILICVPIVLMMRLTKKKVYKFLPTQEQAEPG